MGDKKLSKNIVGVAISGPSSKYVVDAIVEAEEEGIPAVWLTSGGGAGDSLSVLVAAAARTDKILLGTSIMRIWSRHPVTTAEQVATISSIAPGRFRLGVGSGINNTVERTFGVRFKRPLTHLTEYVHIVRTLLHEGSVNFEGSCYTARSELPGIADDVPVLSSALGPKSYEIAGKFADGAITWVTPHSYATGEALNFLRESSKAVNRPTPPLVLHAALCVSDDNCEGMRGVRSRLGYFPNIPFYTNMFERAGFTDAAMSGWTDEMIKSILINGTEHEASDRLDSLFESGASEILVSIVSDPGKHASTSRSMRFLSDYFKGMDS